MDVPSVWMLLTAPGAPPRAVALRVQIGAGVHGNAVRRVSVVRGSVDVDRSADIGARQAYAVLWREKYLDRNVIIGFDADADLGAVHGRSADLAFALAFAMQAARGAVTPRAIAATGILNEAGAVLAVDGWSEKFALALGLLPAGGVLIFPASMEGEVTADQAAQARAKDVSLLSAARIEEALSHLGLRICHTWLECPFRGLEPFELRHASIFSGRQREVSEIGALVRGRGAALVVGASGSGKSSVVMAGVVPALLRQAREQGGTLRWGLLRPRAISAETDPARELDHVAAALRAAWFHGEDGGLSAAAEGACGGPFEDAEQLIEWLHSCTSGREPCRFLLVLDQLEDAFQGALQPPTVRRLCELLSGFARRGHWILATLTRAAQPLLREHPDLEEVFGIEGCCLLEPISSAAALRAVICEPAEAAGLLFEPGLETEIFAAASHGGPDVLPLLELLLTELHERRDQARNELRLADYRAVGGLDGVIAARAESAYAECAADAQALLGRALWKLGTRAEILASDVSDNVAMGRLLGVFRERRLLVQDRDSSGRAVLRAAHEALFRQWPRAAQTLLRDQGDLRIWRGLIAEAGQWHRGERALIAAGPQLEAAHRLCERRHSDWGGADQPVLEYVQASWRQRERRRLLTMAAIVTPLLLGGGLGVRAAYQYVENLHMTRLDFADIAVPPPDYCIAAPPYLKRYGIALTAQNPGNADVLICSNIALYGGGAIDPTVGQHFLVQMSRKYVAPVSFTLGFDRPMREVRLLRAQLWAASRNGVTSPAWRAMGLDAHGRVIVETGEPLLGSFSTIPAKWFVLRAPGGERIAGLRIHSDNRNALGKNFAAFQSVVIQELELIH
jgi:Novel STAND NTPase 1